MILGDADPVSVATGAVLGTVAGVATTLVTRWMTYRKEQTRQDADIEAAANVRDAKTYKDAYKEATAATQAHLRSKDEVIAMQTAVIREHAAAENAWRQVASDCQEDRAEQRAVNHFLLDALQRAFDAIRELGRDPGELPELPPPRPRRSEHEAEFLSRNAAQSARAVKEFDSQTGRQPPKKGA